MQTAPIRIAQISDSHLFGNPEGTFFGLNTERSFLATLDLVKSQAPFDLCLLTGDLAQDHSTAAYKNLAAHIRNTLPYPIYWIPGNHDDPDVMSAVFAQTNFKADRSIVIQNWQIILLNSHKPKTAVGYLAQSELDFLATQLEKYPTHHTLAVLHHHPIKLNCTWIDTVMLENAAEFLEIIDRHKQIQGVLFGHVHQEFKSIRNNIPYLSVPSTGFQFLPQAPTFALDIDAHPGYRWLELFPDGTFKTQVERIKHSTGKVDPTATGYTKDDL